MFCSTCPNGTYCTNPYHELESELRRIETPLQEILMSLRKFEKIGENHSAEKYFRAIRDAEFEIENQVAEAETDELYRNLHECFDYLTSRQRECINLYFWDGLTQEEIADSMGISQPAVVKHLNAAYGTMRKCLSDSLKTGYKTDLYK